MVEDMYREALEYAKKKHEGQFRIGGAPFITHPIAVAEILQKDGYQTEYQIAGIFHDLLEDTDALEQACSFYRYSGNWRRRCLECS
jgi:(p)ppGpp synthase/HD superfamily hydrolase